MKNFIKHRRKQITLSLALSTTFLASVIFAGNQAEAVTLDVDAIIAAQGGQTSTPSTETTTSNNSTSTANAGSSSIGTTTIPTEGTISDISAYPAGTVLAESQIDFNNLSQYFQAYEIDNTLYQRIYGKSYKENCTVPTTDLRYLKVLHYGYDGQIKVGEIMVNSLLAADCQQIFQELFQIKYQIYSMYLVDDFNASDYDSIDADNTSAFNFRNATDSSTLSNHATGCAIDINPRENPYISGGSWAHSNADSFIDRVNQSDPQHMIDANDECYKIFIAHGFTWGGDWGDPVDYQHFQKEVYAR